MTAFVLDASVTISWLLPDEGDERERLKLLDRVADQGAVVPALWPFELSDGLLMAERRGRLNKLQRMNAIARLMALPIGVDAEGARRAPSEVTALAERHGLTVYDAAHLELALRHKLPLATLDRGLTGSARMEAVPVLAA